MLQSTQEQRKYDMNGRIRELAEQANSQHDNFFDLNYKELDVFLEKFAELIVRECAWAGDFAEVDTPGDYICKHLGVKK